MAGPFKMKAGKEGPMKQNFSKYMKVVNKVTRGKGGKVSYKNAWDAMSTDEKSKHGTFGKFKEAAVDYNKKNPGGAPKPKTIL